MSASDIAARRIREARTQRGWRVRDLADRCRKAGAVRLTAPVITNLETRRRPGREITAEELLALARVLEVPPLQLLAPLSGDEELEVVPGDVSTPLDAVAWLTDDADALIPVDLARNAGAADVGRIVAEKHRPLTAMRQIRSIARAMAVHERAVRDEKYLGYSGKPLAYHENSVTILALRLLRLLAVLEDAGHYGLAPAGAMEIIARHDLPSTVEEWNRLADAEREAIQAAREGDADGEGS